MDNFADIMSLAKKHAPELAAVKIDNETVAPEGIIPSDELKTLDVEKEHDWQNFVESKSVARKISLISEKEGLVELEVLKLINRSRSDDKRLLREDVLGTLKERPRLKERSGIFDSLSEKFAEIITENNEFREASLQKIEGGSENLGYEAKEGDYEGFIKSKSNAEKAMNSMDAVNNNRASTNREFIEDSIASGATVHISYIRDSVGEAAISAELENLDRKIDCVSRLNLSAISQRIKLKEYGRFKWNRKEQLENGVYRTDRFLLLPNSEMIKEGGGDISSLEIDYAEYLLNLSLGVDYNNELFIPVAGELKPKHDSEGEPLASSDKEIYEFWLKYSNSKLVDSDGRPKAVYYVKDDGVFLPENDYLYTDLAEAVEKAVGAGGSSVAKGFMVSNEVFVFDKDSEFADGGYRLDLERLKDLGYQAITDSSEKLWVGIGGKSQFLNTKSVSISELTEKNEKGDVVSNEVAKDIRAMYSEACQSLKGRWVEGVKISYGSEGRVYLVEQGDLPTLEEVKNGAKSELFLKEIALEENLEDGHDILFHTHKISKFNEYLTDIIEPHHPTAINIKSLIRAGIEIPLLPKSNRTPKTEGEAIRFEIERVQGGMPSGVFCIRVEFNESEKEFIVEKLEGVDYSVSRLFYPDGANGLHVQSMVLTHQNNFTNVSTPYLAGSSDIAGFAIAGAGIPRKALNKVTSEVKSSNSDDFHPAAAKAVSEGFDFSEALDQGIKNITHALNLVSSDSNPSVHSNGVLLRSLIQELEFPEGTNEYSLRLNMLDALNSDIEGGNLRRSGILVFVDQVTDIKSRAINYTEPNLGAGQTPYEEMIAVGHKAYGLEMRPFSIGSIPEGQTSYTPFNQIPSALKESIGEERLRHGVVTYEEPLTEKQVLDFELVDFRQPNMEVLSDVEFIKYSMINTKDSYLGYSNGDELAAYKDFLNDHINSGGFFSESSPFDSLEDFHLALDRVGIKASESGDAGFNLWKSNGVQDCILNSLAGGEYFYHGSLSDGFDRSNINTPSSLNDSGEMMHWSNSSVTEVVRDLNELQSPLEGESFVYALKVDKENLYEISIEESPSIDIEDLKSRGYRGLYSIKDDGGVYVASFYDEDISIVEKISVNSKRMEDVINEGFSPMEVVESTEAAPVIKGEEEAALIIKNGESLGRIRLDDGRVLLASFINGFNLDGDYVVRGGILNEGGPMGRETVVLSSSELAQALYLEQPNHRLLTGEKKENAPIWGNLSESNFIYGISGRRPSQVGFPSGVVHKGYIDLPDIPQFIIDKYGAAAVKNGAIAYGEALSEKDLVEFGYNIIHTPITPILQIDKNETEALFNTGDLITVSGLDVEVIKLLGNGRYLVKNSEEFEFETNEKDILLPRKSSKSRELNVPKPSEFDTLESYKTAVVQEYEEVYKERIEEALVAVEADAPYGVSASVWIEGLTRPTKHQKVLRAKYSNAVKNLEAAEQSSWKAVSSDAELYWDSYQGKKVTSKDNTTQNIDVELREFQESLTSKYSLKSLHIYMQKDDVLHLGSIIVSKEDRMKGVGSGVVGEIIAFSDNHGFRIHLNPAVADDYQGTTSKSRLVSFYKRFGFVENKGRNKDFSLLGGMYREPVAAVEKTTSSELVVDSDSDLENDPKIDGDIEKLEDFGAHVPGAPKDRWHNYMVKFEAYSDLDKGVKLSDFIPTPNYKSLHKDGVSTIKLSLIAGLISTMPRKGRAFVKARAAVNVKNLIREVVENKENDSDFLNEFLDGSSPRLKSLKVMVELLKNFDVEDYLKLSKFKIAMLSYVISSDGSDLFSFVDSKGSGVLKGGSGCFSEAELVSGAPEVLRGILNLPPKQNKKSNNISFGYRSKTDQWVAFFKGKTSNVILKEFDKGMSREDAYSYYEDNIEELSGKLLSLNPPEMHHAITKTEEIISSRVGDISLSEFAEKFGFKAVRFGNSLLSNQKEAQEMLNSSFDGFELMAKATGIDERAISLGGTLSVAFAERGTSAGIASYDSKNIIINYTRNSRGYNLDWHEFFHGMANYLSKLDTTGLDFIQLPLAGDITESLRSGSSNVEGVGLREVVREKIADIRTAIGIPTLAQRMAAYDNLKPNSKPYYNTMAEKGARWFEMYVAVKLNSMGIDVRKFVSFEDYSNEEAGDLYPSPAEMEKYGITEAFDGLFSVLKTMEVETGLALYRLPDELDSLKNAWADAVVSDEGLFRYPKSQGTDLSSMFGERGFNVKADNLYLRDIRLEDFPEASKITKTSLVELTGDDFAYIHETNDQVWLNVSTLTSSESRGSEVYQMVADYAYNTGKVFIGDPLGLSDIAVVRRTENMLCSALRHGTTAHLRPHFTQEQGVSQNGDKLENVQSMQWGLDDKINLEALLNSSYRNVINTFPEVENVTYSFEQSKYRSIGESSSADMRTNRLVAYLNGELEKAGGRELRPEDVFGRELSPVARALAGSATIKRAVISTSLLQLQREANEGQGIRYNVRELFTAAMQNDTFGGVLYKTLGADKSSSQTVGRVEGWIASTELHTGVSATVVANTKDLPSHLSNINASATGVYDVATKIPYLIAENIRDKSHAIKVCLHESIGHKGTLAFLSRNEAHGGAKTIDVLDRIYNDLGESEITKYLGAYQFDLDNIKDRREAVLEYIAMTSERGEYGPEADAVVSSKVDLLDNLYSGEDIAWTKDDILGLIEVGRLHLVYEEVVRKAAKAGFELDEGSQAYNEAIYKVLNDAGGRLGALVAKKEYGIEAWHGTSASFTEFSSEYINSGEGQQDEGSGLYFSGSRNVAEFYKEITTNYQTVINGEKFSVVELMSSYKYEEPEYLSLMYYLDAGSSWVEAERLLNVDIDTGELVRKIPDNLTVDVLKATMRDLSNKINPIESRNLYQVKLDISSDKLLSFDKPYNLQSSFVKNALKPFLGELDITDSMQEMLHEWKTEYLGKLKEENISDEELSAQSLAIDHLCYNDIDSEGAWAVIGRYDIDIDPNDIYSIVENSGVSRTGRVATGEYIYNRFLASGVTESAKDTSDLLLSLGIKGSRYLQNKIDDGQTPTNSDYSYVVFDDSSVSIINSSLMEKEKVSLTSEEMASKRGIDISEDARLGRANILGYKNGPYSSTGRVNPITGTVSFTDQLKEGEASFLVRMVDTYAVDSYLEYRNIAGSESKIIELKAEGYDSIMLKDNDSLLVSAFNISQVANLKAGFLSEKDRGDLEYISGISPTVAQGHADLSAISVNAGGDKTYDEGIYYLDPTELGTPIRSNGGVEMHKASILQHGRVMPIEIDREGFKVDGEHRYAAMIELGASSIPVYVGEQLGASGRLVKPYSGISLAVNVESLDRALSQGFQPCEYYIATNTPLTEEEIDVFGTGQESDGYSGEIYEITKTPDFGSDLLYYHPVRMKLENGSGEVSIDDYLTSWPLDEGADTPEKRLLSFYKSTAVERLTYAKERGLFSEGFENEGDFSKYSAPLIIRIATSSFAPILDKAASYSSSLDVIKNNLEILDMSEKARYSRAEAMGYDTSKIYYHGTDNGGFKEFEIRKTGMTADTGVFFSSEWDTAESYVNLRADAIEMYSGEDLLKEPDLIDGLEIIKQYIVEDSLGNEVDIDGVEYFEDPLDLMGNYELEDGEVIALRYEINSPSGYQEAFMATREEAIDALESLEFETPGIYEVFLKKNIVTENGESLMEVDWKSNNWDESPPESWALLKEDGEVLDWVYSEEEAERLVAIDPEIHSFEEMPGMTTNEYARYAKEMGFEGVLYKNIYDNGSNGYGGKSDVYVVFNADNIRSINAAFDPKFAHLPNILLKNEAEVEDLEAPQLVQSTEAVELRAMAAGFGTDIVYYPQNLEGVIDGVYGFSLTSDLGEISGNDQFPCYLKLGKTGFVATKDAWRKIKTEKDYSDKVKGFGYDSVALDLPGVEKEIIVFDKDRFLSTFEIPNARINSRKLSELLAGEENTRRLQRAESLGFATKDIFYHGSSEANGGAPLFLANTMGEAQVLVDAVGGSVGVIPVLLSEGHDFTKDTPEFIEAVSNFPVSSNLRKDAGVSELELRALSYLTASSSERAVYDASYRGNIATLLENFFGPDRCRPLDDAFLENNLTENKRIDFDVERKNRAVNEGFDISRTLYNGSFSDFSSFEPRSVGSSFGKAVYLTTCPEDAGRYASRDTSVNFDLPAKAEVFSDIYGVSYEEAKEILTKGAGNIKPVWIREGKTVLLDASGVSIDGNKVMSFTSQKMKTIAGLSEIAEADTFLSQLDRLQNNGLRYRSLVENLTGNADSNKAEAISSLLMISNAGEFLRELAVSENASFIELRDGAAPVVGGDKAVTHVLSLNGAGDIRSSLDLFDGKPTVIEKINLAIKNSKIAIGEVVSATACKAILNEYGNSAGEMNVLRVSFGEIDRVLGLEDEICDALLIDSAKLELNEINELKENGFYFPTSSDTEMIKPISDKALAASARSVRFLLGGVGALDKRSNLAEAKKLYSEHFSSTSIWRKTGWEMGSDGDWRFEISDIKSKLKIDLIESGPDGTKIVEHPSGSLSLGQVLSHPELFIHYPASKGISVIVTNNENEKVVSGSYSYLKNEVNLSVGKNSSISDIKEVLLHEIQHFIQYTEGFALGGRPDKKFQFEVINGIGRELRSRIDRESETNFSLFMKRKEYYGEIKSWEYFSKLSESDGITRQAKHVYQSEHYALNYSEITDEIGTPPSSRNVARHGEWLREASKIIANCIGREFVKKRNIPIEEALRLEVAGGGDNAISKGLGSVKRALKKLQPVINANQTLKDEISNLTSSYAVGKIGANEFYNILAGEVEANNVMLRASTMNSTALLNVPPSWTQKVDSDEQVVYRQKTLNALVSFEVRQEDVQGRIDDLGLKNVNTVVVNDFNGLPSVIKKAAAGHKPDSVSAINFKDTIYLVSNNLETEEKVDEAMLHELAHHGARTLFGKDIGGAYSKIWEGLGGEAGLLDYARKQSINLDPYVSESSKRVMSGDLMASDRVMLLVDELMAHGVQKQSAESQEDAEGRMIMEFSGAIRNILSRHGLLQDTELTDADIAYTMKCVHDCALGRSLDAPIIISSLSSLADEGKALVQWREKIQSHIRNIDGDELSFVSDGVSRGFSQLKAEEISNTPFITAITNYLKGGQEVSPDNLGIYNVTGTGAKVLGYKGSEGVLIVERLGGEISFHEANQLAERIKDEVRTVLGSTSVINNKPEELSVSPAPY